MPGLGASFGRGAATNYQQDLANSDCILIMGSNMAEAHPVGFRWPMKAREKGAKIIHVDPRFTRTSACSDLYIGIRAGSDIAFLGGLINYVLTHDRWFRDYVVAFTNAATIIEEGFQDTEDLDGLFSGFDPDSKHYNGGKGHWGYEGSPSDSLASRFWNWLSPGGSQGRNRRIMYNRASADADGKPWSERKRYLWWDAVAKRWVGDDEPDFQPTKPPDYVPPEGAIGMDAISGQEPFIMKPDGRAWLFAPGKVKDGPLPAHYEPVESPVANLLYGQQENPTTRRFPGPLNPLADGPQDRFPIIGCTFRLTEHYLSGPMSRFNSWLNELQPAMFIELSPELASERGITNGDWVTVRSARAAIEARALVTARVKPLIIGGRLIHQIGVPFHWGFAGETVGSVANDLTSLVADPNVSMHEGKVFTCDVTPGRLKGQPTKPTVSAAPWPSRDPIPDTPRAAQPEGHLR